MIPYYSSTQGKALEEKVENVESKADGCVKSKDGKVHIPYGSAIGGADSAFPNYNFVLKGIYAYAEDQHAHFDDFLPCIMGNNPSTAKLSYSVPIRDVEGRMFTWCSTRTFQTLLDAEVMNLAATKYVIKQEVAKTAVLELASSDFGGTGAEGKTVLFTESGSAKVQAFFATNSGNAVKNMTKVHLEVPNMSDFYFNMFNYTPKLTGVFENIQFICISDATTPTLIIGSLRNVEGSNVAQLDMNDANYITLFKNTGMKITITYTDIPE